MTKINLIGQVGSRVKVFQKPCRFEDFEEEGILHGPGVYVSRFDGPDGLVYQLETWRVQFDTEPSQKFARSIGFALSDEKGRTVTS